MDKFGFEALGTRWEVMIDDKRVSGDIESGVRDLATKFELAYSRFIDSSQISKINNSRLKTIRLTRELANILSLGLELKKLSGGGFDPNIGQLMEGYGYDSSYSFVRDSDKINSPRHEFELIGTNLIKTGSVNLDLGGWGKGWLIDKISSYLMRLNLKYFLVDGGGDMYGTTKSSGKGWRIGLKHPTDDRLVIAVVELKNKAVAGSNPAYRQVGDFHHLINAVDGSPVDRVQGTYVLAPNAAVADGCATALFVSDKKFWPGLVNRFKMECLVVGEEIRVLFQRGSQISLVS